MTRVDPMLYGGCLRYFRRVATNPELEQHEAEFPGCSITAPPWAEGTIAYRAIHHDTGVGARAPARRRILTATVGGGTFAHYMPTPGVWEIIIARPRPRPSRRRP